MENNFHQQMLYCNFHNHINFMIVFDAVTTAQNGITALNLLRENKNNFDLLMTNVDMPNMDGFKLLELVGMDLPVICKYPLTLSILSIHRVTNCSV